MASLSVNSTSSYEASLPSDGHDREGEGATPQSPCLVPLLSHNAPFAEDSWWRKLFYGTSRTPPTRSGMYTIISMTDHRLRPQRPWLRLGVTALAMTVTILCVFFVVPRGSAVGSIRFVPHNWHQKSDHGTYTLQLGVHIPITNYNYYPATVSGKLDVFFLDVVAGSDTFEDMAVETRGVGQELHFCMDASNVPLHYANSIIQICLLFPRKLMFSCKADITVKTWLTSTKLPTIDTYFMVDCYSSEPVNGYYENYCQYTQLPMN